VASSGVIPPTRRSGVHHRLPQPRQLPDLRRTGRQSDQHKNEYGTAIRIQIRTGVRAHIDGFLLRESAAIAGTGEPPTDPPIETSQRISNRGENSGATISSRGPTHHKDVGLRALPHLMIQATCSPGQFPTFLASRLRTTRLRTPSAGFGFLRIQPRLTITMRATSVLSERCCNRTLRRTSEFGCARDH
jgi:hypothetical protein